jgi:hypothetical protein
MGDIDCKKFALDDFSREYSGFSSTSTSKRDDPARGAP